MEIRPLRANDGMLIRCVRLLSLAEAPYALGVGSYDEEAALPDAYWHELARQVGGEDEKWGDRCAAWVAVDGEEPCGTATCYLCPIVAGRAWFTAAWVDPRHRRRGVGRGLVDAAVAWSRQRGAEAMRLWVDDTNPAAVEFYGALGFLATGESQPTKEGSSGRQDCFELRLA
jgi:GNAT superfamily N-acetyltransferase